MRVTVALISLGLLVAGCGGAEPEPVLSPPVCLVPPPPILSPTYSPTKSRVALRAEIPDRLIQALFDDAVPRLVAHEKNVKAGPAGRASYEVERGDIAFEVNPDGVVAATHLKGIISLCKPFGAVCIGYGTCRPEWDAYVKLPRAMTQARAPHVNLTLKLSKGCVLSPVRYNATAELQKITEQQEQAIESQINRSVGKYFKRGLQMSNAGIGTLQLSAARCVAMEPQAVHVAFQPAGDGTRRDHVLAAEVLGITSLNCNPPPLDPELKLTVKDTVADDTRVVTEERVALTSIQSAWASTDSGVTVTVSSSSDAVFVHLSPFGACGVGWGKFVPVVGPTGIELKAAQVSEEAVAVWVNQRGPLVPSIVAQQKSALAELAAELRKPIAGTNTLIPTWGAEVSAELGTTQAVRVVQNELVLTGVLHGTIRGRLQRAPR